MAIDRRKVVWFEGMTLDPHHMQQWDRYQRNQINARVRGITRYDWGLADLQIDRDALLNGELRLLSFSGVLPDGMPVDIPDQDPAPPARTLQDSFGATAGSLSVYLAVPADRRGMTVVRGSSASGRPGRYVSGPVSVVDETTGADEREIEAAQPNIQLRFGGETDDEYSMLQIAEIVRDSTGLFSVNDQFVAPGLTTLGSVRLRTIVRTLLERLVAKSAELGTRADSIKAQREMSPADLTVMGLLMAVNAHIPTVANFVTNGGHPASLFSTMTSLAAQLSVYAPGVQTHPRDFPVYDHVSPTKGFNTMDAVLGRLIGGAAPPTNYVEVTLTRERESLYTARVDQRLLEHAQLFLVVRSDTIPEQRLIEELPKMIRIASPQNIDAVLQSYVRALEIEHTTRLPSGMPVDGSANYMQLKKSGPFWSAIVDASAISIFLPHELNSVNLQFVAVEKN
jgi:type VI secretion system protein ImpJ